MFRVHFTNLFRWADKSFPTLEAAQAHVRAAGFEAAVWQGDRLAASFTTFGGWRLR